jgi:hypothetical protein
VPAFPDTNAHNCARPFTSMLLAIDVREHWVVAEMVSLGLGGDEPPAPSRMMGAMKRRRIANNHRPRRSTMF